MSYVCKGEHGLEEQPLPHFLFRLLCLDISSCLQVQSEVCYEVLLWMANVTKNLRVFSANIFWISFQNLQGEVIYIYHIYHKYIYMLSIVMGLSLYDFYDDFSTVRFSKFDNLVNFPYVPNLLQLWDINIAICHDFLTNCWIYSNR